MIRMIRYVTLCASVMALAGGAVHSQTKMTNEVRPFTKEAFSAAKAQGKTILVEFHAPWCPICRAQEPKIKARLNGDYKDVIAFRIDYDSNRELRKEMNVEKQSTLILYRGDKELGRLSYTSDDKAIDELFMHAKRELPMDRR